MTEALRISKKAIRGKECEAVRQPDYDKKKLTSIYLILVDVQIEHFESYIIRIKKGGQYHEKLIINEQALVAGSSIACHLVPDWL